MSKLNRFWRYSTALGLAGLAQAIRIPLSPPDILPITYIPFIILSAGLGFWPGILATVLCSLELIYFGIQPIGSFVVANPLDWERVVLLVFTGLSANVAAELLRRSGERLTAAEHRTASILESISDGLTSFDNEWRYTYVNRAASRMLGKTPDELLGKNVWELWPHAWDSPFGVAYRRAVAENIPTQVEAFYPEPLNAWLEVRSYPSPNGPSMFFTNTTERRQREEHLRLLESAFLQTSEGTLIVKVSGETSCCQEPVFINAAFGRITGYNIEDLRSGALARLYPPLKNPHTKANGPEGFRDSCPRFLEQAMNRKDGSEFWGEFTFKPLKDESGNYTHCVWTLRDVTERKQAEDTARLLASVVENSEDAILTKNLDGAVVTWNKGAERIYGYSSEEMVGQSMLRLYPDDRAHELPEVLDTLRRGASLGHFESERIRKDGARITVSLTISPIRNSRGYIVGASLISRDITERKLAENALALSEERYRSLAYATTSIVWTTNAEGDAFEDTPRWREFTGQTSDEIAGLRWMDAIHPDDREHTADLWMRAVKGLSFYDTEYRLRRRDGEYRWMDVHGVPVMAPDGTIREWVGTCADVHDRKLAEEEVRALNRELERRVEDRTRELQDANKELESFAYSVSHDLRAPLRAVDGFSRILLEEYGPQLDSEAQRYLTMARQNAVQMGTLIDDLLAFSRLSRQPLTKQKISPDALVRQVIEDLRADREGRQVEIMVGELPSCEGDPQLLKQVYVNLLSNGLKYTSKREIARIEVGSTVSPAGDAPVYYVRDNGVGFDMRYADKLFGVFQRLHGAQEYPGTGVGLAIVQRIVHRHGGRVWANAAVDQGATFYFVLSPAEHAAQPVNEELETCPTNS